MRLVQFLTNRNIVFEENVLLAKKTWIKTGGLCAYWITPKTIEQLSDVCRFLYANQIEFDIIGQTSNIFFHSTCSPQVVISTTQINQYSINGDIIICNCGVNVVKFARTCLEQGYAGFYGLVGLPGTVASAIYNNAGCFQCSLSSMLLDATVLMPDGIVYTLNKKDFGYTYRSSIFKRGERKGVILTIRLKAQKADNMEAELKKSEESIKYRLEKQEKYGRNLGSVFASKQMRRNLRNYIIKVAMKVLPIFLKCNPQFILKKSILFLYGYRNLNAYVSDRQINTFIWKDENAERQFVRYKELMGKVYDGLIMEIEERT